MSGESIRFCVGASVCRELYSIKGAPDSWRMDVDTPRCGACGEVVHVSWDSPPQSGLAFCGCGKEQQSDWPEVVREVL